MNNRKSSIEYINKRINTICPDSYIDTNSNPDYMRLETSRDAGSRHFGVMCHDGIFTVSLYDGGYRAEIGSNNDVEAIINLIHSLVECEPKKQNKG